MKNQVLQNNIIKMVSKILAHKGWMHNTEMDKECSDLIAQMSLVGDNDIILKVFS